MKRIFFATLLAAGATTAALADGHQPTEAEVAKIMDVLAGMECQMDEDDIEKEDGAFELDDVFCADGQYDIEMDENFEVTNRRKE